ncbi:tyrosine-type recombinase/integrase [Vibrio vulnificus]|nr:tyrosine-type recombinase/integrase [Vibrio vulnificus]
MKRIILTQRSVVELKPADTSYIVMDSKLQGLGVHVSPMGKKVFIAKWQHGQQRKTQRIGQCHEMSVKAARQKCLELIANSQSGEPALEMSPTFSAFLDSVWIREVFERWKPSTQLMAKSVLKMQLRPRFGHRRLHRLTELDIRQWFDEYSLTKAGGANRALDIVRSIVGLAMTHGYIKTPLCANITQNPKRTLNRFLSLEEIERLDEAMTMLTMKGGERERQFAEIIRLLLLTGCRCNEIVRLKWSYIDGHEIHLPDSKTGARSVYLSEAARVVLARQRCANEFVFEQEDSQPRRGIQAYWLKVRSLANINDVRIHDLRHTFASHAALMNETLPMISKMLGHKRLSMTLRYTHVSQQETTAAAERISNVIETFAKGQVVEPAEGREPQKVEVTKPKKKAMHKSVRVTLTPTEQEQLFSKVRDSGLEFDDWVSQSLRRQLEDDIHSCTPRELAYRIKAKLSRQPKVKTGQRTVFVNLSLPIAELERYKAHMETCRIGLQPWVRMAFDLWCAEIE